VEIFGMNILNWVISGAVGVVAYKLIDKVIVSTLMYFNPEETIIRYARYFDDKYLDPYKKKFPESGRLMEENVAKILIKAADVVRDKA